MMLAVTDPGALRPSGRAAVCERQRRRGAGIPERRADYGDDCRARPAPPKPVREAGPKAKASALKAVELDDTAAEAHAALESVHWLSAQIWLRPSTAWPRSCSGDM